MCVRAVLPSYFYVRVRYTSLERDEAQNGPRILSVWQQHLRESSGCALDDRKRLFFHLHPDAAGTESERRRRAAKETNRLS